MSIIITSIDVGLRGGIAKHLVSSSDKGYIAKLIDFYQMPTIKTETYKKIKGKKKKITKSSLNIPELSPILEDSSIIIIEDIHTLPHDGRVSAFNFGFQKGILLGMAVKSVGYNNVYLISPQKWKSILGLKKVSKSDVVNMVNRLYNLSLNKSDDGIADAIMIGRAFIKDVFSIPETHIKPYK